MARDHCGSTVYWPVIIVEVQFVARDHRRFGLLSSLYKGCMHNVHTRACSCMYAARHLRELGLAGDKRQAADQQVTMLLETAMARQLVDEPLVIVVDNIGHLYNANDCEQQFNNEVLLVTDYTQLVDAHTQTNDLPHVDTATDEVSIFNINSFIDVLLCLVLMFFPRYSFTIEITVGGIGRHSVKRRTRSHLLCICLLSSGP